jgi:hypothetical protein
VCSQSLSLGIVESKLNLSPRFFTDFVRLSVALFGLDLFLSIRKTNWNSIAPTNQSERNPIRNPPDPPKKPDPPFSLQYKKLHFNRLDHKHIPLSIRFNVSNKKTLAIP